MCRDEIGNRILALGMQGLLYHSIACAAYNFLSEKTLPEDLLLLPLLYFPLFLFAAVRGKCGNFYIFMLFHVMISGIFILLVPGLERRIAVGGCIAIMAISSIRLKMMPIYEREECPPSVSVVLFLLSNLAAQQMGRTPVVQISYYEAFLFLIVSAVHRSLANTASFIKANAGMENLPVRQMKGMNKMLLGVFVLFLAAGMPVLDHLLLNYVQGSAGEVFRMAMRRIITVIIWILKWIFKKRDSSGKDMEISSEESARPQTGEVSIIAQILEQIVVVVVHILFLVGVVYLAVWCFYRLYRRFYEHQEDGSDKSEFLWKNPLSKERTGKKQEKRKRLEIGNVNQRIRQMYKRYVRRQFGKKSAVPPAMTPTELENSILEQEPAGGQNGKEDDAQMMQRVEIYEKARYSKCGCGKEDMEAMKQNLKARGH